MEKDYRLGERLFQNVLLIGRPHIVICRNRDEELRLGLRGLQMGTVRHLCHESAAMEGGDCSDAIGHGGRFLAPGFLGRRFRMGDLKDASNYSSIFAGPHIPDSGRCRQPGWRGVLRQ